MNADPKKVGRRIKNIRLENGLTTKEFGAFISGASDSLVSRWEQGVNLPNAKRLKLIALYSGITVDELLYGKKLHKPRIINGHDVAEYLEVVYHSTNFLDDFDIPDIIDILTLCTGDINFDLSLQEDEDDE